MSNNDWYSTQGWYEPMHRVEPVAAEPQAKTKNKKKRRLRIIGASLLVVLLLVGSSLAFRDSEKPQIEKPGMQDNLPTIDPFQGNDGIWDSTDEMPDNVEEFFNNFLAVIEGKAELIVKHEESRLVMKVLDACFRSYENGTVEKI